LDLRHHRVLNPFQNFATSRSPESGQHEAGAKFCAVAQQNAEAAGDSTTPESGTRSEAKGTPEKPKGNGLPG